MNKINNNYITKKFNIKILFLYNIKYIFIKNESPIYRIIN